MAFTNYVLQAGIVVPICLAFSLFDRVRPTLGLALAVGVGAVQIAFSVWRLRRHPFGPMEWLWRRVTYGHAPGAPQLASALLIMNAPTLTGRVVRLEPLHERHRELLRPMAQDERIWTATLTHGMGPSLMSGSTQPSPKQRPGRACPLRWCA